MQMALIIFLITCLLIAIKYLIVLKKFEQVNLENKYLKIQIDGLREDIKLLQLQLIEKKLNSKMNQFTQDELKSIRFAIHPDKNDGKNNDLFIKVNNLLEK